MKHYIIILLLFIFACKASKTATSNTAASAAEEEKKTALKKIATSAQDSILKASIDYYIPKEGDADKIVKVNFNIFQDDSGKNNFQDIAADRERLNNIFTWMSEMYANNPPPSDPVEGVKELKKTYIQFELGGIYFYKNTRLSKSMNSQELLQAIKAVDPMRMEQYNICFTAATYGTAGGISSSPSFNLKEDMWIVMFKTYNKGSSMGDYAATTTLAHELGHSFDLLHTYIGGGASAYCGKSADDPEYLSDVFGPWPGNCPHFAPDKTYPWGFNTSSSSNDRKTNNMMGGFQSSRYFSPKQIGIMHRALTIKTAKRYVK